MNTPEAKITVEVRYSPGNRHNDWTRISITAISHWLGTSFEHFNILDGASCAYPIQNVRNLEVNGESRALPSLGVTIATFAPDGYR